MISGDGLSILVLDDDVPFLESFKDFLMQDGHSVIPATRGIDAVELVRKLPVDLSFLDFDLPDLDGLETLVRIHRQRPGLPAVFLTGNASSLLERKVLEMGAFALIRKPFDAWRVRGVIREGVIGKSVNRENRSGDFH
jgi:DNA-binding response OmpR family regulator